MGFEMFIVHMGKVEVLHFGSYLLVVHTITMNSVMIALLITIFLTTTSIIGYDYSYD